MIPHSWPKVAAVLASTGLDPAALGLEITETVWVSDTARVAGTLTALHDMGIGLSLDDLGSGYSSIAYLNRYPVFGCFKIDKSYIKDLPAAAPHGHRHRDRDARPRLRSDRRRRRRRNRRTARDLAGSADATSPKDFCSADR